MVSLNDTELPEFTVITGKNGAGKSHLLEAIDKGNVKVDIIQNHNTEIRLYNWNSLVPNNEQNFDSQKISQERYDLFIKFSKERDKVARNLINIATRAKFPHDLLNSAHKLATLSEEDCIDILGDEDIGRSFHNQLLSTIQSSTNSLYRRLDRHSVEGETTRSILRNTNKNLFEIERDEFIDCIPVSWGTNNIFQQSFGRLFLAYRDLLLENRVKRCAIEDGESELNFLSNDEFYAKHGKPPWDFVNEVLKESQLDFKVDHPPLYLHGSYKPQLTKISSNIPVNFSSLSSGEKVLMSFALCLYYARDKRQISAFPKLLLFDEIDAPLHPSMCQSVISTITKTLVEEYGIHVILATHSASSVALAPPESIHVMKDGVPGIHKVTKGKALNVLTAGVPTLAIGFDGRRQVFVESKIDSLVYEQLFLTIKQELESDRSLSFIAVGKNKGSSVEDSGCQSVKRIVSSLAEAGNLSVLGLIDWDRGNSGCDRVHILAEGICYSLENCIYDPAVVAALIARDANNRSAEIGISNDESYMLFRSIDSMKLQKIARNVEELILGEINRELTEVQYLGGLSIQVSRKYLQMQGHRLEELLLHRFKELKKFNKHSGDLMKHIVNTVFRENLHLIPKHLSDTIVKLLESEIIAIDSDNA